MIKILLALTLATCAAAQNPGRGSRSDVGNVRRYVIALQPRVVVLAIEAAKR